ncbi:MAG TPA: pyruvate:ferredoxin (flavodoxin) oxidoreductase [Planctomycetota bacterium]|jgi:pyruvate-ferredoxin/flavodoxin oxidoreductase|nr:pyruvate:ferredoxin (flavodoxin) oxidoreductase [Planctomycetota bacterium]OQC20657.1 MAG: Pyruvate-flavodoxin oxidoreductase [Planctomycetes bacterium ADurb.Bin069]HNR98781.1 pyruvate:ferredoxin (flavodoxin) oxidoreductase [Planctomycetota bacterium]HNU25489.1 pyruvate:ferredoxin (flavodoxin) oxidoreductase [Planctomycetota bacterium]HOE30387.1 pyruvate:ferredoxin (flavodoxin) oxidoreductase [Planctomycetota bacterium]
MARKTITVDGNEAAACVAHKLNEVIVIYPITPSSPMGEWADEYSAEGQKNIFGTVPQVTEMQSEAGAAAAVHGALMTGALCTTFTASQGLLLMIPTMFKIAGELLPTCFHVSARTVATHALSIFGDHSDIGAVRSTGWALLASNSIQEIHDFALIAQAAALESRVPFVHFFDGFRSSHEVQKIEELSLDDLRAMIDEKLVAAHRARALTPDRPTIRGTAQNPDVFFQARETCNPFYAACPAIVQKAMDKFAALTGRKYNLFDYVGAPDAERVVVIMGSGAETVEETVEHLCARGEKVGLLKVRLLQPFAVERFAAALPPTVKSIAVLDRTKEPGAVGEPLYIAVHAAVNEARAAGTFPAARMPKIIGGRYGLSSKEFTPGMVKAVYDELAKPAPKNHFTVGITDDLTGTSLEFDPDFSTEGKGVVRAIFYGLGSDGTVGANKNSIKIIGEETPNFAQGYFVYDSRKAGSVTVSHLRFGPNPIRSTYLISRANFVACHQQFFLERFNVLEKAEPGATFLLNSQTGPDKVWDTLPRVTQEDLIAKKMKFYVIDAYHVARETGMGVRINTIMQTCFFAISGVLPREEAIEYIKKTIKKTYGAKGDQIVKMNFEAVDQTLANLHEIKVPAKATSTLELRPPVPEEAPDFVRNAVGAMIVGHGDDVTVAQLPNDGIFDSGTTQFEKRNLALEIPIWDPSCCIQCGKCSLVCPHAAIRIKGFDPALLAGAPASFRTAPVKGKDFPANWLFTVQTAPEDCTGCALCVTNCPGRNKTVPGRKAINMEPQPPIRERERENYAFFLSLPNADRTAVKIDSVKGSQLLVPLFEYSGACAGCGETPYVKLLTQLFGDRLLISNATGCSSIYGGNLPTFPYTKNDSGRGPAWCNSLFEDNAEFGFGYRLCIDKHAEFARELLTGLSGRVGEELVKGILEADQGTEAGIAAQRERIAALKQKLAAIDSPESARLRALADYLVKKSVWVLGGDGWAYDIGYGGLDHVLASGRNVNVLVLDTEVYSNTGGQMSKSTPTGAVAKFAAAGKPLPKKDMGMIFMTYGNVYVARVAMGYNDLQTVRAMLEADAYDGPSLIIAYSHCIAHGIDMSQGLLIQKAAVDSGHYPLFRFNPKLAEEGKNPLKLDSKAPKIELEDFTYQQTRFKMLTKMMPQRAKDLLALAKKDIAQRWRLYEHWAAMEYGGDKPAGAAQAEEASGGAA